MLGVVIPAYKRKDCLRKTLQSLTLQTKQSFYVIVVDDHSPEPLKDVIDEFKWKLHIKYIYTEQNGGPGVARQIGLNYCYEKNFDYVVFLDSDDLLFPQAIARLDQEIHFNDADLVSFSFWSEDKKTGGKKVEAKNKTFIHGKIYRTEFLLNKNITFPALRTNEDLAFNMKVFGLSNKIYYKDEVIHLFCAEQTSLTRCGESKAALQFDYIGAIYDSCNFIKQHDEIDDEMIMAIFNCYNSYQRGICLGGSPTETLKKQIAWLLGLEEFQSKLKDVRWLRGASEILVQGIEFNEKFITFPKTFNEWLEEMQNYGNSNN